MNFGSRNADMASTSTNSTILTFTNSTPSPRPELPDDLPVDINFWFFLFIYYGAYLAVALIWVTCLFNLYRRKEHLYQAISLHKRETKDVLIFLIFLVNWWPRKLGGRISYFFFWAGALCVGALIHYFDIFGIQKHRKNRGDHFGNGTGDWERKTFWVSLAFGTMAMPALV